MTGTKARSPCRTGSKLHQAMASGAFAQRVVVAQTQVVKIGDDIPMDVASLIACGVITGVGAVVNAAQMRPGQDAVVIGAGGVGLNAIQGARIAGARAHCRGGYAARKARDCHGIWRNPRGACHG